MEVAGLLLSAVALLDPAIRAGKVLYEISGSNPAVARQVSNTTRRLEAQRYTLKIWESKWTKKALEQGRTSLEDAFQELWGPNGYEVISQCLVQLNLKFGEAQRTLQSIDPDSFTDNGIGPELAAIGLGEHLTAHISQGTRTNPSSLSPNHSPTTANQDATAKISKKTRWYRRISPNPSNVRSSWKFRSSSTDKTSRAASTSRQEQARLNEAALQERLTAATRIQWSMVVKENLRLLISEIDDWIEQLRYLAVSCAEEREASHQHGQTGNSRTIRNAAKALYSVIMEGRKTHRLDFKLELERADPSYFDRVIGPVSYLDNSDHSYKFPLLVSNGVKGSESTVLLAEALVPSIIPQYLLAEPATPFEDIINQISRENIPSKSRRTSLLLRDPQTVIFIHQVGDNSVPKSPLLKSISGPRCSLSELIEAGSDADPFLVRWKRLQLACIISTSVLHLYETGWISQHLDIDDFYVLGPANKQYAETVRIAPFVSSLKQTSSPSKTPFDCLRRPQLSQLFKDPRDERLAMLFYRLGIVLFEIGRGRQYSQIFGHTGLGCAGPGPTSDASVILAEVEKIPFGQTYRKLVMLCLTGSLYDTGVVNIDNLFNTKIVNELEGHFSAIVSEN